MGSRGSSSSSGTRASGTGFHGSASSYGLAGQTGFTDGNKVSVASTLDYWEGKSKGLGHEELLMIGEDGFATGYYKGGKTSVAFAPPDKATAAKTVVTHNHPLGQKDGRTIGGGFSNADVTNHIECGFKETRATSVEGTYYFKSGKNANPKGFLKALRTRGSECAAAADKYMAKHPNANRADVYLTESHKWYTTNASKYGFEYGLVNGN